MSFKAPMFTEYLYVLSFRLVMNLQAECPERTGDLQKFDYKTALKSLLYPLCLLEGE